MTRPSPAPLVRGAATGPDTGLPVRWSGGRPVVLLTGEVDMGTAPAAEATARLLRSWQRAAVVDASAVTFMDVAGLRAVESLAQPGRRVEVHRPSPAVLRLLAALERAGAGPLLRCTSDPREVLVLQGGPDAG